MEHIEISLNVALIATIAFVAMLSAIIIAITTNRQFKGKKYLIIY